MRQHNDFKTTLLSDNDVAATHKLGIAVALSSSVVCLCKDSLTKNKVTALEGNHSSCDTSQGKQTLHLHSHDSKTKSN